jgi:iron complex transport system substrate-binding protein
MIDRGYPQFVQRLEKSGIRVVSLQPGTVDEMYVYWEILGLLTGRGPQAAGMIKRFQQAVADLKALTASVDPRKGVYFEAIHEKMKTFSPDSMAVFALEAAGGRNVAADAQPVRDTNIAAYGKERILARAADIDVYLAQSGTMNPASIERIRAESGFQAVRAVKANQVYIIDERLVSRPTLRLLDGIFEIGRLLYPDVFTEKTREIINRARQWTLSRIPPSPLCQRGSYEHSGFPPFEKGGRGDLIMGVNFLESPVDVCMGFSAEEGLLGASS